MWPFRKRPPKPLAVRRARFSRRVSLLLHVLLLGFVAYECLMLVALPLPEAPAPQQVVLRAEPLAPPQPPLVDLDFAEPSAAEWLAKEAVDIQHVEEALGDPRFTELTEGERDERTPEQQAATSNFVTDQVMRSIAQAERHSDEDNLERLRNLADQQNRISTEESVAAINAQLNKFLSTGPRATAPAKEPVAGDFDFDTAQLHDVRREELPGGGFKYTAVLIDSAGRTLDTEMNAAEGESAFKTFELIKQNPLLERVYRGVVMSLLDKVLKPGN